VFGTQASRFNDDGVSALYQALLAWLRAHGMTAGEGRLAPVGVKASSRGRATVPAKRARYLAEIADTVRGYHRHVAEQAGIARERQSLRTAKALLEGCGKPAADLDELIAWKDDALDPRAKKLLELWPKTKETYAADEYVVKIRDREIRSARLPTRRSPERRSARSRCRTTRTKARFCAG